METCVILVSTTVREDHNPHLSWKDQKKTIQTCDYQWFPLLIELPCELSKPSSILKQWMQCILQIRTMLLGALSAVTTTYLSWIVNRVSATSGSLNTDVAFVLIDLLSFPIRIWINVLTALKGYQPPLFLVLSILAQSFRESTISLKLYFQFMDCGSQYFGPLARILRIS